MTEIYEYQKINISLEPSPDPHGLRKATIESAANRWAKMGWRTVGFTEVSLADHKAGYADSILIERKILSTDD